MVSAQDIEKAKGKISGTIVDAENGEAIIGANVLIVGTSRGDATDIESNYMIENVDSGTYTIQISFIPYANKTLTYRLCEVC